MPCAIVDGQIPGSPGACVHFGFGYLGEQVDTTIRDARVVAGFRTYFDQIWKDERAIHIKKEGRPVSKEAIDEARASHARQALYTLLGRGLPQLPILRDFFSNISPHTLLVAEVIPDYDTFRKTIAEELGRTRQRWWITRIQDRQTSPDQEDEYFDAYERRLANAELNDVRRLITVPTRKHLSHYEKLLDRFGQSSQLCMKVWTGPAPPSTFDLILGDDTVILAFGPGSSIGPPTWGLKIRDLRMTQSFAEYYDHMWNQERHCVSIKEDGPLSDEQIRDAKRTLRSYLPE